jgi:hypothetical protein
LSFFPLVKRTGMSYAKCAGWRGRMQRDRFVAALREEAKAKRLPFAYTPKRDKGSHAKGTVGTAFTFVPDRDIDPKTAARIRKTLGL